MPASAPQGPEGLGWGLGARGAAVPLPAGGCVGWGAPRSLQRAGKGERSPERVWFVPAGRNSPCLLGRDLLVGVQQGCFKGFLENKQENSCPPSPGRWLGEKL